MSEFEKDVEAIVDPTVDQGEVHPEHAIPVAAIFGYLVVLTIATSSTLILSRTGMWGPMTNILFTLMVSVCKATLVVGFFMHLKFEKSWKYALCVAPCVLAVIAVCALLPDIAYEVYPTRPWNE